MKTKFPIRKTDDKSTVIERDVIIFDDFKGVIDESKKDKTIVDDRNNPYDKTLPVLIEIVRDIGHDHI